MKKLALKLEMLDVESFATGAVRETAGTVHGFITLRCSEDTCDNCNTMTCDTNEPICTWNTKMGLTCEYDTCGACNETDPNCTNYCPTGVVCG